VILIQNTGKYNKQSFFIQEQKTKFRRTTPWLQQQVTKKPGYNLLEQRFCQKIYRPLFLCFAQKYKFFGSYDIQRTTITVVVFSLQ
jgi:hypothetical protein